MANYRVVLRKSDEGYSVSCPGLPGCWSQGVTEEEALANIQVAIREYVEAAEELAAGGREPRGRSCGCIYLNLIQREQFLMCFRAPFVRQYRGLGL
jgi:predicted RNase H-like HicB family nuclease